MIRLMENKDRNQVIDMMTVFYASNAVKTNGSLEIFTNDVDACLSNNIYLEGYIFEEDNVIQGYAMIAKSYSTEFGKPCIWVEDIYIKEEYRGKGLGSLFFDFIKDKYLDHIFRLEVESDNTQAVETYKKNGFEFITYDEMIKL